MLIEPTVVVVDADEAARDGMGSCLRHAGLRVDLYDGPEMLLDHYDCSQPGCLILELRYPGMTWCELRRLLMGRGCRKPFIIVTRNGSVTDAVQAMREGAVDFIEKPYQRSVLLERVLKAFDLDSVDRLRHQEQVRVRTELAALAPREHEVLQLVAAGKATRDIAMQLALSPKTVEVHRSNIVGKMHVDSIAELIITMARLQVELPTPTVHRRRA